MDINPIRPPETGAAAAGSPGGSAAESPVSFKDLLKDALTNVNQLQQNADAAQASLATGQSTGLDDVMLAVQKADLALQMTMSIRNKLIEAYQDVTRMQI